MGQIANKMQRSIFLLGVYVFSLLKVPTAFADMPAPTNAPYLSRCLSFQGSICTDNIVILWDKLFLSIVYFLVGTLTIELPIFFLLGFRTKKKLGLAVMANVISVPLYHITNALLTGTNVLIAETFIIVLECVFLVAFLKKEMSVSEIIIATIVANIVSFILGTILIHFVPFFYY